MSWDTGTNLNPRYRLPRPAPRASTFPVPKDGATKGEDTATKGGWARYGLQNHNNTFDNTFIFFK